MEHAAYMTVEKQLKTGPTNVLGQCLCSAECLGLVSPASPSQMVTDGQYSSSGMHHYTVLHIYHYMFRLDQCGVNN